MSRTEIMVTLGVAFLAVLLGYMVKGVEFRRAERLSAYGAAAGTFQTAVYAGVMLLGLHMQFGDTMTSHQGSEAAWADWSQALRAFRHAIARARIVASPRALAELEKLEVFMADNVLAAPPFTPLTGDDPTAGWGEHVRHGARPVEDASVVAARDFADAVARDFSVFRR